MKTFQFKQHNKQRAIIVAMVYLLIIFSAAYLFLGGINGLADKVNSIGSAKGAGFIIGIVILAPLFILLQAFHPLITVDIDSQKMMIRQKGRQDMIIHLNAIDRIELNMKSINRLDIYDRQNNLLTHLQPTSQPQVLQPIITEIVKNTGFTTHKNTRKIMGKDIDTLVGSNRVA